MKAVHMVRFALALAASLVACGVFGDITVKDGEVLLVGTIGSGPNNKNDGSVITLEAGATLKGTNEPPYASWTIWRNLYATNGVAYLDCSEMKPAPMITKHAILTDGLQIRSQSSIEFHDNTDPDAGNWYIRDLAGLAFEGGSGTVKFAKQATLVSTPSDPNVTCVLDTSSVGSGKQAIAIAGPNLRLSQIQNDPADFTGCDKVYLFDDSYIPEGHSISVGSRLFRVHPAVVNRETRSWESVAGSGTVTHPISLVGGTLELCAPLNANYAFAGKVSGSGTIKICRDAAPSLTSCAFAEIDGRFVFRTGVAGRTLDVTVENLATGSVLDDGGCVNVKLSDEVEARICVVALSDGSIRYVMPDDEGCIAADVLPAGSRKLSDRVVVGGATRIAGMPAGKIGAAAGARVSLTHDGSAVLKAVPGEGTVAVVAGISEDLPLYWFDASKPYDRATLGTPYYTAPGSANTTGKKFGNIIMTNDFPYVESWNDWRGVTSGRFYLGRYYQGDECVFYPHSYPYLAAGAGPNGLGYLCFGVYNDLGGGQPMTQVDHEDAIASSRNFSSKRRLDFTKSVAPKSVIMVFGSQQGGGCAVLGTGGGHRFQRGRTLDDPIVATAPANTTFWLDGSAVADPTQQTFNGGWQVLSISGDAVQAVTAIGFDVDYKDAGGQNYGEIIFFQEALTDEVRRSYEHYLARKWGIASYEDPAGLVPVVRAEGQGGSLELTPETEMELCGTFGGTVVLKGGTLKIAEPLPPTAEELPTEGRLGWYDADAPGAIVQDTEVSGGETFTNLARGLLARGRAYADVQTGETYLYGQGGRVPFVARSARGLAKERTWIDFNHPEGFATGSDDGNTMRFSTFGDAHKVTSPAKTGVAQTFRTAFMAIDSSHGGGSPFLSEVMGGGGDFRRREATTFSTPIWPDGCSANVKNGQTRINGERVDGTASGAFTGDPETLTLVAAGDVSTAFVDYFGNSQSNQNPPKLRHNGIVFGELLLYTTELAADDIAKVEAYLRGKWTGTLPEGYSDLREATVDGTGDVVVADVARLPRFAPTFAGSVTAGGDAASFAFSIDDAGKLAGAFVTPEATYDLPAAATLTVDVPGKFPPGRYELFVCKGFVRPMDWTLDVKAAKQRQCDLVTETKDGVTRVVLNVSAFGLMVIVK